MRIIDYTHILLLSIDTEQQDKAEIFLRVTKLNPLHKDEIIKVEPSINIPFKEAIIYKVVDVETPKPSTIKGFNCQKAKLIKQQ